MCTNGIGGIQTVFFVADHPERREAFDTVITMSRAIATAGIWPAIDPQASQSRWIVPEVAGETHAAVAERVRKCLTEADALDGHENPDASARATVARARGAG